MDDAAAPSTTHPYPSARPDSTTTDTPVVHRNVGVYTSDGTRLATDVYCPARDGVPLPGPHRVILERTPYSRERPATVELAKAATRRGCIFVAQDVRGRFDSEGTFKLYFTAEEGPDGADLCRWIVAQPWYGGGIATVGGSFSAVTSHALALALDDQLRPHLRAQVQRASGVNYYKRGLRTHGTLTVGLALPWVVNQAAASPQAQADPLIAAALQGMQRDLPQWIAAFPFARGESPLALCPEYEDLIYRMYETGDATDWWRTPAAWLEDRWAQYPPDVALLMVSGWYDHHAGANFDKLRHLGSWMQRSVSLIVGPWVHGHGMLDSHTAGDADFGPTAAAHGPVAETYMDWVARHLDPADDAPQTVPPLTYFRMGSGDGHKTADGRIFIGGEWHTAETWPPAGTYTTPFFLGRNGSLTLQPPGRDGGTTTYTYDPTRPCPTVGGTNLQEPGRPDLFAIGPQDQRTPNTPYSNGIPGTPLADRPDVRVFQTPPLTQPLEITGPVEAHLWVSSSTPDTDIVAKLIDVHPPTRDYPDGYAMLVCEDILRLRYRDDRPTERLIEPGRPYRIRVDMGPTSILIQAGHRIRLDITSSNFPEYDPNPNTGEPLGRHTHTTVAHQTIHHHAAMPSHLDLPLRPIDSEGPVAGDAA